MSHRIRRLAPLHNAVFLLNSRLGQFTAATNVALLIPKLRSHFAEFLDQVSLLRLGILYPPTCVGLRYGVRLFGLAFLGTLSGNAGQP